ncbi:MAG: hypothetical protein ACRDAS_14475, partial [Cetobacterium sp.]
KNRNSVILAVSLGLGYGLGNVPEALTIFPESIKLIFGGSGIVVSGTIAVLLNIILPLETEEVKIDSAEEISIIKKAA